MMASPYTYPVVDPGFWRKKGGGAQFSTCPNPSLYLLQVAEKADKEGLGGGPLDTFFSGAASYVKTYNQGVGVGW